MEKAMTEAPVKISRREQILQALAHMLEVSPGNRITTAKLAAEVGVSEAALYRHFPSKAKMFEGLIAFIEETIFSRINMIMQEEHDSIDRCRLILTLLLTFAEKNPGMCRIMIGDALAGETDRLRQRVAQFFDRLETQLKQVLRETEIRDGKKPIVDISTAANLMLSAAEGRINQFVRSEFTQKPTEQWVDQWRPLSLGLFG